MIRKAPGIIAGLLLLLVPLSALAQGGGVTGQIVNGTIGEAIAGQPVRLHITPLQDGAMTALDSETDAEGNFTFDGVELTEGNEYALCTTYQGAMYHLPVSLPSDQGGGVNMDITVYDATESAEVVSLQSFHMVFNPIPERGAVEATEFLVFRNESNTTFIGRTGGEGAGETLRFTLPTEATEPSIHTGPSRQQTYHYEGGFASLAPVLPGTTNVVYSYLLPVSGSSLQVVRALDYPPGQVVLLIGDGKGTISGPGISSQGPVDINGTVYQLYRASPPAGDTALEVTVSGWPGSTRGQSAGAKYAPILAGTIAGGGLLGVLAYALFIRKRRPAVATANSTPLPVEDEEDWDDELE